MLPVQPDPAHIRGWGIAQGALPSTKGTAIKKGNFFILIK
jgi:hypothetical protein